MLKQVSPVITVKSWKKQAKLVAIFNSLLALSIDPRAKVRKEAQQTLREMYTHENGKATGTNSGNIVGKFVVNQLMSQSSNVEEKKKTISYIFTMISAIAPYLPLSILTNLFETIFAKMQENSNFIRTQGYVVFASVFSHRPNPLNQDILP